MNINFENIEKDILKKVIIYLLLPVILIITYYYFTKNLYVCLALLSVYLFSLYKYVKNRFSKDFNITKPVTAVREFGTKVFIKKNEANEETKTETDEKDNLIPEDIQKELSDENPEPELEKRDELIIEEFVSN